MKRSLNKFYSLALLASLAVASAPTLAQMHVAESTTSNGTSLNLVLPVNLPSTTAGNYWTGLLSITPSQTQGGSGSSFAAFCIDPFQYSNASVSDYSVSSGLGSLGSTHASWVSNLYSQNYASSIGNATGAAAFQLALWDLAKDDGVLTTGKVQVTASTESAVVKLADSMITGAKTGPGTSPYSFSIYISPTAQDYVVASVTPVPEPENYAMLLAGLGLMGAVVRRRKNTPA
jgi:PEP-CTERM motif